MFQVFDPQQFEEILTNFFSSLGFFEPSVSPLIFATLSVAIAFRAGLFNIGAAGQMAVGAMAADMIGLTYIHWPGWLLGAGDGYCEYSDRRALGRYCRLSQGPARRAPGVTTIMLNWIAFWGASEHLTVRPRLGRVRGGMLVGERDPPHAGGPRLLDQRLPRALRREADDLELPLARAHTRRAPACR